ncbi:MAG: PAS domain S-box protein [Planctomycetota bacterium]|jgi:PAS domain S-box-containing protein
MDSQNIAEHTKRNTRKLVEEVRSLRSRLARSENNKPSENQPQKSPSGRESYLSTIFDNVSDVISYVDANGTILDVNKRVEDLLGYTPDEVIGKSFREIGLIQPQDLNRVNTDFEQSIKTASPQEHYELELIHKNGKKVVVEIDTSFIKNNGKIEHIVNIFRDITDHKQAELEVTKSYQRFTTVMDSLDAFVYVTDMETYEVLFCNKYGQDIWGDIIGKTCWKVLQSDQTMPCAFCTKDKLLDNNLQPTGVYHWEFQNTVNHRWYDCRDQAIRWTDGRLVRMGIATDITERRKAEGILGSIVKGTSQAIGKEFFGVLVKSFASAFGYQYALVGEVVASGVDRIKTLAVWAGGEFVDNFEYDLAGTPCENVVGKELCLYQSNVQEQFPDDHLLVEMGVESYLGMPLFDSSGQALGILIGMDTKPIEQASLAESIMPVFATRAALELERNSAEKTLQTSEEKFLKSFYSTPNLMCITELENGRIIDVNDTFINTLGYNREELINNTTTELNLWANAEDRQIMVESFEEKKQIRNLEIQVRTKSGEIRRVLFSADIIELNGKLHIITIANDITKRIQAEMQVHKHKDFLELVINSLSHPFYVIDADDYKIKLLNSVAAEYGDISGTTTCHAFSHNNDKPCNGQEHHCPIDEVKKTKKPVVLEHIHYDKSGKPRNVEVSAYPILDSNANVSDVIEYCVDITERRKAEEAVLKHREQLFHMSRLNIVGEMGTGLAHELNQPLCAILGTSEACLRLLEQDTLDKSELAGPLEAISEQAKRAAQIIRHVRALVRKEKTYQTTIEIGSLIPESLALAEIDIRHHNIKVELKISEPESMVLVDVIQIQQVLLNLIRNAIEAMEDVSPGQRRLTIETSASNGDFLEVAIADTGPGLLESTEQKIFDSFYTTKTNGLGMGLPICQSIIENNGGKIWAVAPAGSGSVFKFTLPKAKKGANQYMENQVMSEAKPTLFVVDDDEAVRNTISLLAKTVSLNVEVFSSADEFLETYEPGRSGALVLDVRMPGKSGIMLQEELANRDISLPIIFLSGHGDIQMAVEAVKKGAVDFIEKPFSSQVLLDCIQQAIAKDAQLRQRKDELKVRKAKLALLTEREREIMNLLVLGHPDKLISNELKITRQTVALHRAKILKKMQVDSLVELVHIVNDASKTT